MSKYPVSRGISILALAILIGAALTTAGFAQAYKSQVAFLEEFAARLYERGDYPGAMKEFERIARLDPNNASAAEHIRLITARTGQAPAAPSPLEHIDSIITDITSLKKELVRYDTDNREMEYLIRNLITENDALYAMLYKRSRELAELRTRFDGTPYAEAYTTLMKTLPPDRVPQHLHQSNELLALVREQTGISVNIPANEVEALIQDVSNQKKTLAPTPQNEKIAATIDDKREVLVDKTLALLDKQESLATLKDGLTEMNATLKSIDAYYQTIKSGLAEKNFTEQKQFADLMTDYAAKLKEIESLKAMVEAKDLSIAPTKEALAQKNTILLGIEETLAAKDKQIAEFKALLAQKNALIEKQQADLAFTNRALDKTGTRLTSIEGLLEANDRDLADLQDGISQMRLLTKARGSAAVTPVIPEKTKTSPGIMKNSVLKTALTQKDAQIAEMKTHVTKVSRQLAQEQAALAETRAALAALNKEHDLLKTTNTERTAFFNTLNTRLDDLSSRTENKDAMLVEQQKTIATLTARVEKTEAQALAARAELSEKTLALRKAETQMRTLETELTKTQSSAQRSQNAFVALQEANIAKGNEITQLKNDLEILQTTAESLRGKIVISSPGQARTTGPQEETNLLHKTLSEKDSEIVKLKERLYSVTTVKGDAAQCQELDLQEKMAEIARLNEELNEKNQIIQKADAQSASLQEKISVLEAKQDAIKGVVQKRDMEFLQLKKEVDKLKTQRKGPAGKSQ